MMGEEEASDLKRKMGITQLNKIKGRREDIFVFIKKIN
jgi:hypothetical protein